ncbi:MAG: ABC transporter permease [Anaerolineae bacterium]|nr:ABC transporter permease [Anaerolineae bacterium]
MRYLGPILRALVTAWLAATLVFFGMRLFGLDGLSAQYQLIDLNAEQLEDRLTALSLNRSAVEQYALFLLGVLRADLGQSFYSPLSVTEIIAQRLPSSVGLTSAALLLALPVALLLGLSAHHVRWGRTARAVIALGLSLPIYWTGTLVAFSIAVWLGGVARNIWLAPMLLGWHVGVGLAQVVQSQYQQIIVSPFWRAAQARGLRSVYLQRHALPHIILALLPILGSQFAFLLSGAIVTESIFLRPGLGTLLIDAVLQRDYPLVQGVVIVLALLVSGVQTLARVLLVCLDPRLRCS